MCCGAAWLCGTLGCAAPVQGPTRTLVGDNITVRASQDAIAPAVRYAVARHGMVVLSSRETHEDVLVYDLLTVRDEPGELVGMPVGHDTWRFVATVGRFGNVGEEAGLLVTLGDRLNEVWDGP